MRSRGQSLQHPSWLGDAKFFRGCAAQDTFLIVLNQAMTKNCKLLSVFLLASCFILLIQAGEFGVHINIKQSFQDIKQQNIWISCTKPLIRGGQTFLQEDKLIPGTNLPDS